MKPRSIFFKNSLLLFSTLLSGMVFSQTSQRFKRMDYEYDLASGQVTRMSYAPGAQDQLMHRYEYDADNRISKVYTSTDGVHWDCDAAYTYYHHGPLGRTELGDQKVQGIDQAYTLQGWIKGVNSTVLDPAKDIGKDGATSGVNARVARDVFGYSLGYFKNDYAPVNAAGASFLATTNGSPLDALNSSLYNGNIRHTTVALTNPVDGTALAIQGSVYRYDQLNRLVSSKLYHLNAPAGNSWVGAPALNSYDETLTYDANGNIKTLVRAGSGAAAMDNLTYRYTLVDGKPVNNRLLHVNDAVTSVYSTDIDNQGTFVENDPAAWNYGYDALGNLTKDQQEKISSITWTPGGKVKEILRTPGSGQANLEFKYNGKGQRVAKIMKPDGQLSDPTKWVSTFYVYDAQDHVMATYEKKYNATEAKYEYTLAEQYLYGQKRLGSIRRNELMLPVVYSTPVNFPHVLGSRQYELGNHLGNVLSTISDRKIAVDNNSDKTAEYYKAHVLSTTDYYVFGSPLPARDFNSTTYRYGFNEQEKVDEISGSGNHTTALFWEYSTRLGRRWNLDPVPQVEVSDYAANKNNPIWYNDKKGDLAANVIGAVIGAGVDYGMQVTGNMLKDGSITLDDFKDTENFTKVNTASIVISGISGFATAGTSSMAMVIGKEGIKKAAIHEAQNIAMYTAESIGKQVTADGVTLDNIGEAVTLKKTLVDVGVSVGVGNLPLPTMTSNMDKVVLAEAKDAAKTADDLFKNYEPPHHRETAKWFKSQKELHAESETAKEVLMSVERKIQTKQSAIQGVPLETTENALQNYWTDNPNQSVNPK